MNNTPHFGGGVRCDGMLLMENCLIADNVCNAGGNGSHALGGGVYALTGPVALENSEIVSNQCNSFQTPSGNALGGGVFVASASMLTLTNSIVGCNTVFAGTGSINGAGVYSEAAAATIENTTLARNSTHGLFVASGTATCTNCIIYHNDAGGTQIGGAATVTYSDVQNGFAGTGNINFNPQFMGSGCDCGELISSATAPTVDAGNPAGPNDVCLPPSKGGIPNDMGAYGGPGACNWLGGPSLVLEVFPTSVLPGDEITFTSIGGTEGGPGLLQIVEIIAAPCGTPGMPITVNILPLGCFGPDNRWTLKAIIPPGIPAPLAVTFQSFRLNNNGACCTQSNKVCVEF